MATTMAAGVTDRGEQLFFFAMAGVMAAVIVGGFGLNLAMGRSSFAVPLVFHLHAAVFFGWVALYLAQTGLVANGNVALHRRLGWLAALWLPLMVVLGCAMTVASLRRNGGPFFFDANEFLVGNPIGLLAFAGLASTALVLRRRTDWHRRLLFCAMATLTSPGLGRLLPMPALVPWAWEISSLLTMAFLAIGMIADRRRYGRIHLAWYCGLAVGIGWLVLGEVLAYTSWGYDVTRSVLAGYPGAARPMEAYLP